MIAAVHGARKQSRPVPPSCSNTAGAAAARRRGPPAAAIAGGGRAPQRSVDSNSPAAARRRLPRTQSEALSRPPARSARRSGQEPGPAPPPSPPARERWWAEVQAPRTSRVGRAARWELRRVCSSSQRVCVARVLSAWRCSRRGDEQWEGGRAGEGLRERRRKTAAAPHRPQQRPRPIHTIAVRTSAEDRGREETAWLGWD